MIYFLRAEQDSYCIEAGWIKIGTTTQLSVRLGQIADELDHTPTVLAVLDGAYAEERALHKKFKFSRGYGEWFRPHTELLRLIETEGRPWDGEDEVSLRSLVSMKGTDEFEVWLDELVSHARQGTRTLLLKNALAEYAESHGFKKPQPRR